jgi:hypothetical protein
LLRHPRPTKQRQHPTSNPKLVRTPSRTSPPAHKSARGSTEDSPRRGRVLHPCSSPRVAAPAAATFPLSQLTVPKRPRNTDDGDVTTAVNPTTLAFEEYAKGEAPLPSWNEGSTKQSIMSFVRGVTTTGDVHFVKPEERIAVFDNDGTLWSERPAYFQLAFVFDRLKALAPQHPEWKDKPLYAAVLAGDMKAVAAGGLRGLLELATITHAGMTTDEFARIVEEWIAGARHPKFNRPYTELIFQPMLELLAYLRANGFKTFIVSGGGVEFMRVFAERVYGVPPEQVIGSSIVTKFEMLAGVPVLTRLPELNFMDDNVGKPVAINMHIGRRPIAAFGNSDGDLQMLQWTTAGAGSRFALLVNHTDPVREYAYQVSTMGKLDVALTEAKAKGWTVVDMKNDWNRIYPFEADDE